MNPATDRIYVANRHDGTVSVIDGASNTVIATIPVGERPFAIVVNPTTDRVYVANRNDGTVSVIATVRVGAFPLGVGVNSSTNRVYVWANLQEDGTVRVIDGASNAVIATISVGAGQGDVGVNSTTNRVYVANQRDFVSVLINRHTGDSRLSTKAG